LRGRLGRDKSDGSCQRRWLVHAVVLPRLPRGAQAGAQDDLDRARGDGERRVEWTRMRGARRPRRSLPTQTGLSQATREHDTNVRHRLRPPGKVSGQSPPLVSSRQPPWLTTRSQAPTSTLSPPSPSPSSLSSTARSTPRARASSTPVSSARPSSMPALSPTSSSPPSTLGTTPLGWAPRPCPDSRTAGSRSPVPSRGRWLSVPSTRGPRPSWPTLRVSRDVALRPPAH
jgi:hypothetical protein